MSMFAKLNANNAFNKVKSTLSGWGSTAKSWSTNAANKTFSSARTGAGNVGTWTKNAGSQMGDTFKSGYKDFRAGASLKDAAMGVGKGLGAQWKHGDNAARIGMGVAAAGTAAVGAAAADFVNPWGLGWGD